MKTMTIVGARPQFIKAAPVSKALREAGHTEILVHTGQHYDDEMSAIFFRELEIPEPDFNLNVGSGSHAEQTAKMLTGLENLMLKHKPGCVLVYGDTNSTLAGALAAAKLNFPVAHVEAGLRSFNREMPEEYNRIVADHCAKILFCPTKTAVKNLLHEGITQGVHLVGDTMYDAILQFAKKAEKNSTILKKLKLHPKKYLLATVHRPYNTDVPENLKNILKALGQIKEPVIFPVHPRTQKKIEAMKISGNIQMIKPVGYLDMLMLEKNAQKILTDSGGMQKEAYFLGVPCITLRPETEWIETVESGWNLLTGADPKKILDAIYCRVWPAGLPDAKFGDGQAATKIMDILNCQGRFSKCLDI